MKIWHGIGIFLFGIEKVWKKIFENAWEPCLTCLSEIVKSDSFIRTRQQTFLISCDTVSITELYLTDIYFPNVHMKLWSTEFSFPHTH